MRVKTLAFLSLIHAKWLAFMTNTEFHSRSKLNTTISTKYHTFLCKSASNFKKTLISCFAESLKLLTKRLIQDEINQDGMQIYYIIMTMNTDIINEVLRKIHKPKEVKLVSEEMS